MASILSVLQIIGFLLMFGIVGFCIDCLFLEPIGRLFIGL